MARALWNGVVLAESQDTVVVEGNHYFPREALEERYFTPSRVRTLCPWKGIARYDNVTVDGVRLRNAAWEYRHPLPLARRVKGRVAFWGGIQVVDDDTPEEVTR
jgi:uncharacterized protein (DUF427 family)